MSVNSPQQNINQFKEWYKWFNKKYNRYHKLKSYKPAKKHNR